jgi:hypothetical protein
MNDLYYLIDGTKAEEFYGEWNELDEEIFWEDIHHEDKN